MLAARIAVQCDVYNHFVVAGLITVSYKECLGAGLLPHSRLPRNLIHHHFPFVFVDFKTSLEVADCEFPAHSPLNSPFAVLIRETYTHGN